MDALSVSTINHPSDIEPMPEMSNIPNHFQPFYRNLIKQYSHIFSNHTYDVGRTGVIREDIVLKDESKITSTPPYQTPELLLPVVHNYIQNLANAKVIRPSTSPFSSPLMLVKKMDTNLSKPLIEQYWVVHDYQKLNNNAAQLLPDAKS